MIRVAIGGLFVETVQSGLTNRAWSEDQLNILEGQLQSIDFLPHFDRGMRAEPAGMAQIWVDSIERTKPGFFYYVLPTHIPRGWLYQNLVVSTRLIGEHVLTGYDISAHRIFPQTCESNAVVIKRETEEVKVWQKPFRLLASIAIPNFPQAVRTVAHNQTAVQLATLGCALERYRLAEQKYQETLRVLIPRFIEKLPNDILTGESFMYRRLNDETFILYSVGWDQVDNGGTTNDWIWPNPSKWK